jgi:hypothetical protein
VQIKLANFDLTPAIRGFKSVGGFALNGQRAVQTAGGLRADFVSHFDRGNRETVLQFSTHHEFATIEDAQAWLFDLELLLPTRGLLEVTMRAGNKTVRRWIANAVCPAYTARHIGLATLHTYEIRGGRVLKEAP